MSDRYGVYWHGRPGIYPFLFKHYIASNEFLHTTKHIITFFSIILSQKPRTKYLVVIRTQ
jgi:hypothetical protein